MKKILLGIFICIGFTISSTSAFRDDEIAIRFCSKVAQIGLGALIVVNSPVIAEYLAKKARNINHRLYAPTEFAALIFTAMTGLKITVAGLEQ